MSLTNKGGKLAVLSLIGLFTLTGCGETEEIYSKPSNYDSPIISIKGDTTEIHHNLLSIIYDAMHEGSVSSKVLDEAMYRYASSVFGIYNEVELPEGSTEITLKKAYSDITFDADHNVTGGGNDVKNFIKAHKAYWYYNEEGKHIDEQKKEIPEGTDWTPGISEIAHVASKWEAIETRIAEAMYSKVSGTSYAEKNYYNEVKFLKALHEDGKKVKNYLDTTEPVVEDQFIIPYTVEDDEVFDEFRGYDYDPADPKLHKILHREYYQDSINNVNFANTAKYTYIEDEVIPTIYGDLLIEQYLLDEEVAAVRNSRARKINVIKIEKYSSFTNNADMLVKELLKEIYALPAETEDYLRTDAAQIEEEGDNLFEKYAVVAKGLKGQITGDAQDIVDNLHDIASDLYEVTTAPNTDIEYFKHTTAGDLVEDYDKLYGQVIAGDYELIDSDKFSTFTSSGTRSIEEGYNQQLIDIMQKQSITKGWYIQSKTPSLDSNGEINDRLFKLSIANAKIELDSPTDSEGHETDAYKKLKAADRITLSDNRLVSKWEVRSEPDETENRFLCSINGAYYLKFDGQSTEAKWTDDIVYDDGNAYYIVQVLEAAKDSKLRNVSTTNYAKTRSQVFMDAVIDEVAKIVGETGNYATLSKNHWLEKMDLSYYDQEVYDYFKTNYPDLFEE